MEVRLVILSPSGKHRTLVKRLPILVGRADEAKLRISQDCVSRRHCEFRERDGEVVIRDLTSTNGTIIDGEQIVPEEDRPVRPGAVVKVGGATFRVEYGSAGTTVAAPLAAVSPAEADRETVPLDGAEASGEAVVDGERAADWPALAEPTPPDEGDLNDFFKSLS